MKTTTNAKSFLYSTDISLTCNDPQILSLVPMDQIKAGLRDGVTRSVSTEGKLDCDPALSCMQCA